MKNDDDDNDNDNDDNDDNDDDNDDNDDNDDDNDNNFQLFARNVDETNQMKKTIRETQKLMVRIEAVDDDWNIIRYLSFRLLPPLAAGRLSFESDFNLFLKGFFLPRTS